MTSSAFSSIKQHYQQPPTRRHFERPSTRVWPFAMDALMENSNETEAAEGLLNNTVPSSGDMVSSSQEHVVSKSKETSDVKLPLSETNADQQHQQQVGCAPFFGVKHYLHNFYGLPDLENSEKLWRHVEADGEEDYFAILTSGQSKSEVECWHVHRRCFAWSVSLGTLIILLGMTCLLLGFLLPRHPILVGQMEENDLKMWIAAHTSSSGLNLGDASVSSLNILDRKAVEHNNILDILKVGGLMATCLGVLLLVVALIFPPGRHPSTWGEEDNTPHTTQINQALKNCLRSIHSKNHPTFFYSGLVASTTDEKIPVFQHLQSVQPQKN